MLDDLDETIRQLLIRYVPLELSEIDVSFDAPDREWSGRLSRPTVNCFLYDVRENLELRQVDFDVQQHRDGTATLRQAPLRIDATYQITAWARAPEDEHQLLWRVMSALFRNRKLPTDALHGALVNHPYPLRAQVAQPAQSRSNPAELWQALDNRIRPALSYTLTLPLDPEVVFTMPLVFTRHTRMHHSAAPDTAAQSIRIGGTVRGAGDLALVGAQVIVRETGAATVTDNQGRFALPARLGPLTLLVSAPGGETATRSVEVPSASYDLEI